MNHFRPTAILALIVAAVVLLPGQASAHALIASSQPRAGQTLGTAPGVVSLQFTEPLNAGLSKAAVIDPTGRSFAGSVTGSQILIPLSGNAPGTYQVDWTSVSALDGHVLHGSFHFAVGVAPRPAGGAAGGSTSLGRSDLLIAVPRAIEDGAILLAIGMLALGALARRGGDLGWVRPRLVPVLGIALVSGAVVLGSQASAAAHSLSPGALAGYLTTGLPGWARLSRLALEAVALAAARRGARGVWALVLGIVFALAASGHAAAIHPAWWGIAVDAVHLAAAGLWAGGIMALAGLRPPGGWGGAEALRLLKAFSGPALAGFFVSVGFGGLLANQSLGSIHQLASSSYGRILLAKIGFVAVMVPLSVVAWRKRRPLLRSERVLAALVISAGALLGAFPVPPGQLARAEAAQALAGPAAALPSPGELTMGGQAGQVLVGISLRPGLPGPNEALVYLLPLDGIKAAGALQATLTIGTRSVVLATCGDTCRQAAVRLRGGQSIQVRVPGPKGGTATFTLPALPAPDGTGLLELMHTPMHALRSYRINETLSSGMGVERTLYSFQAPDRLEADGANGSRLLEIGDTRYLKNSPTDAWNVQVGGPPPQVPAFIWDYFKPFVDPRIIGHATVDGTPTTIVSFFGSSSGLPIWFRLSIDSGGLVRNAQMDAQGHFMDDHYLDLNGPIDIVPPAGQPAPVEPAHP
jgi:copper transport protein